MQVVGISSFPVPHLNAHRHLRKLLGSGDDGVAVIPQTFKRAYDIPHTVVISAQTIV